MSEISTNFGPSEGGDKDTRSGWEKRVCARHGLSVRAWGVAMRRCNELYPWYPQSRRVTLPNSIAVTVSATSLAVNGWIWIVMMGDDYARELGPLIRNGATAWFFTCLLTTWSVFYLSCLAHNTRARLRRRRHILHFLADYDHTQSTNPRTSLLRGAVDSDDEARDTYLRSLSHTGETQTEQLLIPHSK